LLGKIDENGWIVIALVAIVLLAMVL